MMPAIDDMLLALDSQWSIHMTTTTINWVLKK